MTGSLNKILGRTKIMNILRICNVLDYKNRPFPEYEERYFVTKVKIHKPCIEQRKDYVTLIKRHRGLNFVKKNY